MNTETFIILAVYVVFLLIAFAGLILLYLHIKQFQKLSPNILKVFKIVFSLVILVSFFGFYQIIAHSQKTFSSEEFDISRFKRLDF